MTEAVQQVLNAFDALSDPEKQEAAAHLLQRALELRAQPLSDNALVEAADQLFREIDAREAANAQH